MKGLNAVNKPLSEAHEARAKELFREWFERHPYLANPTDINREEKYDYAVEIGWSAFGLMQRARKSNVAAYGYPYPFTKAEYWQQQQAVLWG